MSSNAPSATAGVTSQPSPYSVDERLQRLEQVIRNRGFAHFDHGGEAAKVGLTMRPAHVLVFGNPRAGTPLMVASPLIALDLPLKTLVWQDDGGQVWVSYNQPPFWPNATASHLISRQLSPGWRERSRPHSTTPHLNELSGTGVHRPQPEV